MSILRGVQDDRLFESQILASPGVTLVFEKLKDINWINLDKIELIEDLRKEIIEMRKHPKFKVLNFGDRKYLHGIYSRNPTYGISITERGHILNIRHHFDIVTGQGVRRKPMEPPGLSGKTARKILSRH
jgi:hypothetical protein